MAQLTHRAARSCPVHGAASGAVDKLFHARLHLSQRFDCPIKRDHFSIRDAISTVMEDTTARRVVIVGFIGANPLKWISNPRGLEVYCWPKAGATDPRGINALLESGARVHFLMKLHTKVYYSSSGGTVLGSANWSDHALGDSGLTETAIWLPAGAFPIDEQLAALEGAVHMDNAAQFSAILQKLHEDHNIFCRNNPDLAASGEAEQEQPTFGQWAAQPNRPNWQLGLWSANPPAPADAVKKLVKAKSDDLGAVITNQWSNYRAHWDKSNIRINVPTLDCDLKELVSSSRLASAPEWWIPSFQTTTSDPEFGKMRHVWLAREDVPAGSSIPFNCQEPRFVSALRAAVRLQEAKVDSFQGTVPDDFIDLILQHY